MSTPATMVNTLPQVYKALGTFIAYQLQLASGLVYKGFPNRTNMPPPSPGFVVMSALVKKRLRTNVDSYAPTGSPAPAPGPVTLEQGQQIDIQIDCYGPTSSDWADILTTLLRDEIGCDGLAAAFTGTAGDCQPLYADDPIRAPLDNAEMQYEDRWIITARIQYNPIVSTADEYATGLVASLYDVTSNQELP